MDLAAKKEELSSVNVEAFAVTFDRAVGLKQEDNKTAVALCCSEQNPHLDQLRKDIIEAQRQPGIEDGPAPAFTPASDVVLHPTTAPATIIRGASSHLARTRLSHNTELSRRMQA